jgi:hypothetical protein
VTNYLTGYVGRWMAWLAGWLAAWAGGRVVAWLVTVWSAGWHCRRALGRLLGWVGGSVGCCVWLRWCVCGWGPGGWLGRWGGFEEGVLALQLHHYPAFQFTTTCMLMCGTVMCAPSVCAGGAGRLLSIWCPWCIQSRQCRRVCSCAMHTACFWPQSRTRFGLAVSMASGACQNRNCRYVGIWDTLQHACK